MSEASKARLAHGDDGAHAYRITGTRETVACIGCQVLGGKGMTQRPHSRSMVPVGDVHGEAAAVGEDRCLVVLVKNF